MNQAEFVRTVCERPERCAWLSGAGASRNINLPTTVEIIADLNELRLIFRRAAGKTNEPDTQRKLRMLDEKHAPRHPGDCSPATTKPIFRLRNGSGTPAGHVFGPISLEPAQRRGQ